MLSNILHAFILGLLQGFTEFLPVSSSAHLILLPKLMHWEDFGLPFDITIHMGSLLAIIIYFFNDKQFKLNLNSIKSIKILALLIVGTVPVGVCGLMFKNYIEKYLRSIELISLTTMFFGVLLGIAYYVYLKRVLYNQSLINTNSNLKSKFKFLTFQDLSVKLIILIGLFESIAIIPGTSRSGITLTAGLLLGFNLLSASKISFLLAIPVILAAGLKQTLDLIYIQQLSINYIVILTGFISSFFSSLIFVVGFFKYIEKLGMWPFVIYRVLLGIILWISFQGY